MSDNDENWQETLPESVRGTTLVTRSDSLDKFWERVAEYDQYRGQAIRIPGEDAGEDAMKGFYQKLQDKVPGLMRTPNSDDSDAVRDVMRKLGMPEKAEGYSIPEGVELSPEALQALASEAYENNMTNGQFKKMAKRFADSEQEDNDKNTEWKGKQEESLKSEWGMAAEERYKAVLEFAKASGASENTLKRLENRSVGAEEVLWLYNLSEASRETGGSPDDKDNKSNSSAALSPAEAEEKLAEIYNNPDHPYHKNSSNPNHPAVKRVLELVKFSSAA
jgi:hypothetical protein